MHIAFHERDRPIEIYRYEGDVRRGDDEFKLLLRSCQLIAHVDQIINVSTRSWSRNLGSCGLEVILCLTKPSCNGAIGVFHRQSSPQHPAPGAIIAVTSVLHRIRVASRQTMTPRFDRMGHAAAPRESVSSRPCHDCTYSSSWKGFLEIRSAAVEKRNSYCLLANLVQAILRSKTLLVSSMLYYRHH